MSLIVERLRHLCVLWLLSGAGLLVFAFFTPGWAGWVFPSLGYGVALPALLWFAITPAAWLGALLGAVLGLSQ
jgi:hypothetical protein